MEWNSKTQHHPFCNFFALPREGCKMCEKFYKRFPMDDVGNPTDVITKYFPDVAKENNIK